MTTISYEAKYANPAAPDYSDTFKIGDTLPGTDSQITGIQRLGQPANEFVWGETSRSDRIQVELDGQRQVAIETLGWG
jgi:hypothetical protein